MAQTTVRARAPVLERPALGRKLLLGCGVVAPLVDVAADVLAASREGSPGLERPEGGP